MCCPHRAMGISCEMVAKVERELSQSTSKHVAGSPAVLMRERYFVAGVLAGLPVAGGAWSVLAGGPRISVRTGFKPSAQT